MIKPIKMEMKTIKEIHKEILEQFPERYYKTEPDKYGNVLINDVLNTEPVCEIYHRYHPYAVDLILDCLRKSIKEEVKI